MSAPPELFATTRWSVVLAARERGEPSRALETLCRVYWPALYAYARRQGSAPHDAEDATQSFFAKLLEKDYLQAARRERGPFRAFLQMAFKRFLGKERERAAAERRGGGAAPASLDFATAELAWKADASPLPADAVFERQWALSVLEAVMQELRSEFRAAGKEEQFDVLKRVLDAPRDGIGYGDLAAALGVSEGAARVAAHRLRKRFRELFREEVAHTVAAREEADEEMRHLISVLARA